MSDDGETVVIVGTCGEISEKNGWTGFSVQVPGKDYPVKVSTKLTAIVEQGRAVGQGIATWTYLEKDSGKENPNRPGTSYKDRWLQKVEAGESATPQAQAASDGPLPNASGSPQSPSTHTALPAGDRERSIIRQTCIKAASELYSSGQVPSTQSEEYIDWPLAVMQAADRFERWIMRDLEPDDSIPF